MDDKLNFPSMNAFFMEDPDNPGTWAVPVLVIDGDNIKLINIKEERLDFIRSIIGTIAKKSGARAYFIEYDIPSKIEEIQPVEHPNIESVSFSNFNNNSDSEIRKNIGGLLEHLKQLIEHRSISTNEDKPDEDTVH